MEFEIRSRKELEDVIEYIDGLDSGKAFKVVVTRIRDTRTDQQRKAIELYCKMMADALNDAGYEFVEFMQHKANKGVQVPWSQDKVKDEIWRPIQEAMVKKVSTTKLSSAEVSQVYDVVNRKMGELSGVSMNFPDRRG